MPDNPNTVHSNAVIRLGRSIQLPQGISIGLSLTLAVNVFVLVGWMTTFFRGGDVPLAYILSLVIFLPVVLTYIERAMSTRGSSRSGMFDLVRSDSSNLRTFTGGWLLLIGHLGLAALLGWGLGLYLNVLFQTLFGLTLATHWLALLSVLVVGLGHFMTAAEVGMVRARLIYIGLVVVILIIGWTQLTSTTSTPIPSAQSVGLWSIVAFLAPSLGAIGLVLDYRQDMRRPGKVLPPALLVPFLLGGLVAAGAASAGNYPHVWAARSSALIQQAGSPNPEFLNIIFVITGLYVCLVALDYVFESSLRLIEAMADNGFLSERQLSLNARLNKTVTILILVIAATALIVVTVPTVILVGVTGLSFLWVSALLNGPDLLRLRARPARKHPFQLPFYPLFPGLVTAIGFFLPFALPWQVLAIGITWVVLGGFIFVFYARRRAMEVHEEQSVFRDATPDQPQVDHGVMVAITSPYHAVPLIRAGLRLAQGQGKSLIVLYVLKLSEQLPQNLRRFKAQQQLQLVEELVQRVEIEAEVPVIPFVRVSASAALGIIETVREEKVDLLLVGWEEPQQQHALDRVWERVFELDEPQSQNGPDTEIDEDLDPILNIVLRTVPCDVVILRGQLPGTIDQVLVPMSENLQVTTAIRLAQLLVQESEGQVATLYVVPDQAAGGPGPDTRLEPQLLPPDIEEADKIEQRIVHANSIQAGILNEARQYDLVLMNASRQSLLEEDIIGGIPAEVARTRRQPTMLVRPFKGIHRLWLREAWYSLTTYFPKLSDAERAEVSVNMRQAAQPNVDFFILITLAATIATWGLLQGSTAVIIGAMLVAPLMSPIVSTAMGVVEGDTRLMRVATEAAIKGIAIAIGVGVAVTLIAPEPQQTAEIMNRTQPTLLDLAVALASGAAAGYALCRRHVAAALPGVAIAVALVPPLCVVGYGIATANFEISGGALLLFSTNLIAIILAAAIVFLLLGFHALPQYQEQFQRGFVVSVIFVILIAIPLAFLLNVSLNQARSQRQQSQLTSQVESILNDTIVTNEASVLAVRFEAADDGYIVHATILDFADFGAGQVAHIEDLLNDQLDVPLTLQTTILKATLTGREGELPGTSSP